MKEWTELFEARRRARGEPCAVATVLRVEGSSYRREGARMLVGARGRLAGSVSGGCLEQDVVLGAQAALREGRPRLLVFDTADPSDALFGSGLGCQGRIWIGIELLAPHAPWPWQAAVRRVRERRVPEVLVTRLRRWGHDVRFESEGSPAEGFRCDRPEGEAAGPTRNTFVGDIAREGALVEWITPPAALALFGGGPEAPPLVRLAAEMGHDVTVIDRRPHFAAAALYPGAARVLLARPERAVGCLQPDRWTAAVVMNHHFESDRDILAGLVSLPLGYIGVLGPRRRTERMLDEIGFEGAGSIPEIVHAPAGLDIGAGEPAAIALAILAEIHACFAKREGGMLGRRSSPIHDGERLSDETACALPA